jgi:transcriptional regulator with XRE-family HTH domain
MSTGNRIQARREALGLSREDLAKRLGISALKLWRIETGRTAVKAHDLAAFAKGLRTKIEKLVA